MTACAHMQGEDPSMMSQMSRDSGMSMNSLQTGYSGDTGSLPSSLMGAHNDWEIAPMDIEILRREDGSPWELGAGAFGKVTPLQHLTWPGPLLTGLLLTTLNFLRKPEQ